MRDHPKYSAENQRALARLNTNEALHAELRLQMTLAAQSNSETTLPLRVAGFSYIGFVAALSFGAYWLGASSTLSILIAILGVGLSLLAILNAWGMKTHQMQLYGCDQALKLHESHIDALADGLEESVYHVCCGERRL